MPTKIVVIDDGRIVEQGTHAELLADQGTYYDLYRTGFQGMKPVFLFRVHAVQRMFERNISIKRVKEAVETGPTIEDYSAEMPEPGRLILGYQGKRPFHVVISEMPETKVTTVITVYLPDPHQWHKNFVSRKS